MPPLEPPDLSGCLPHAPRGCTGGSGPPAPGTPGVPGQIYVNQVNGDVYVFYDNSYHLIVSGGGTQEVFPGHYGNAAPPFTPPAPHAVANDLDEPFEIWLWDPDTSTWK